MATPGHEAAQLVGQPPRRLSYILPESQVEQERSAGEVAEGVEDTGSAMQHECYAIA